MLTTDAEDSEPDTLSSSSRSWWQRADHPALPRFWVFAAMLLGAIIIALLAGALLGRWLT
jgi:hypothetical protein